MARLSLQRIAPRWSSRLRLRTTLVVLVSIAYGLVLTLNILALLAPPRLSLVLAAPAAGRVRVAWLLPGSTLWASGVRPGDRVLVLDSRPPVSGDAGGWTGERLRVRRETGGIIEVTAARVLQGHTTWPLALLSPWFLLFGTLVILRASRAAVGRATYALFASAALGFALAPAADSDEALATVAEWVVVPLFAACFAQFFLTFPLPQRAVRLRALLLVPPLLVSALGLTTLARIIHGYHQEGP